MTSKLPLVRLSAVNPFLLELREEGTTLSREIAKLCAEKASQDLAGTDHRVADIAQTVGFTDPTVFSRAFKNWTEQSPQ